MNNGRALRTASNPRPQIGCEHGETPKKHKIPAPALYPTFRDVLMFIEIRVMIRTIVNEDFAGRENRFCIRENANKISALRRYFTNK